jgi:hypothetical protein
LKNNVDVQRARGKQRKSAAGSCFRRLRGLLGRWAGGDVPFLLLPVRNETKAFPRQLKTGKRSANNERSYVDRRAKGAAQDGRRPEWMLLLLLVSRKGVDRKRRGQKRREAERIGSFLESIIIALKSSFGGDLVLLRNEGGSSARCGLGRARVSTRGGQNESENENQVVGAANVQGLEADGGRQGQGKVERGKASKWRGGPQLHSTGPLLSRNDCVEHPGYLGTRPWHSSSSWQRVPFPCKSPLNPAPPASMIIRTFISFALTYDPSPQVTHVFAEQVWRG